MIIRDETIVELSRSKIVLMIVGSVILALVGAWLFSLDEAAIRELPAQFRNKWLVHGTGFASILFFGLCATYGVWKLFDTKPGLVFSRDGILDNSSAVAAGLIPWSEVTGVGIFEYASQKMMVIKVKDPGKYVQRGNPMKRALNQANLDKCGSPITIAANSLKLNFDELLATFNRYHMKYSQPDAKFGTF